MNHTLPAAVAGPRRCRAAEYSARYSIFILTYALASSRRMSRKVARISRPSSIAWSSRPQSNMSILVFASNVWHPTYLLQLCLGFCHYLLPISTALEPLVQLPQKLRFVLRALPLAFPSQQRLSAAAQHPHALVGTLLDVFGRRSEAHTSELQSLR